MSKFKTHFLWLFFKACITQHFFDKRFFFLKLSNVKSQAGRDGADITSGLCWLAAAFSDGAPSCHLSLSQTYQLSGI